MSIAAIKQNTQVKSYKNKLAINHAADRLLDKIKRITLGAFTFALEFPISVWLHKSFTSLIPSNGTSVQDIGRIIELSSRNGLSRAILMLFVGIFIPATEETLFRTNLDGYFKLRKVPLMRKALICDGAILGLLGTLVQKHPAQSLAQIACTCATNACIAAAFVAIREKVTDRIVSLTTPIHQSRVGKICLNGLLFGLLHTTYNQGWNNLGILAITTFLGCLYAALREATGDTLASTIAHSLHNLEAMRLFLPWAMRLVQ